MNEKADSALATEALGMREAFVLGLVEWADVIQWGDGWISRLELVPHQLIVLSLSSSQPDDGWKALSELAVGGNGRAAFLQLIPRWKHKRLVGELGARELVRQVWTASDLLDKMQTNDPLVRMAYYLDHLDDEAFGLPTEEWRIQSAQELERQINTLLQYPVS